MTPGWAEETVYSRDPNRDRPGTAKAAPTLSIDVLVGIPTEDVVMATFPYILKGIRDRAESEIKNRVDLDQITIDVYYRAPGKFDPRSKQEPVLKRQRPGDLNGAILVYPFAESAVEMISRNSGIVSVLESYDRLGIDVIDTADASAFLMLVERLHAAGHKRIGFLSWHYPIGGHWVARRFSGYVEALFVHGLDFRPEWVLNVRKNDPQLSAPQLADAVASRIRESGVTAWVCAADHQAYQLMRDLQERAIRVPEDCSITGFDGLEPPPGLRRATSMRVPNEHIGASALSRVINRVIYPHSPLKKILVEAELVAGETVAAPRSV